MVFLVEVNGSFPSREAIRAAAASARVQPNAELVLLYVVPSARPAEMAGARRLLETCRDRCMSLVGAVTVRTCLEVGNRLERLAQTAERLGADCVVVASHDGGEFPRLKELGESAWAAVERIPRPVLVVGRDGARRFEARVEVTNGARA
jgi:nucleotide-binding universal stress UspA family protein